MKEKLEFYQSPESKKEQLHYDRQKALHDNIPDELDNQGKVFISYKIEDTYIHDTKYGTKKLNHWICIKDYLKEIIKEELKVEKE